MGATRANDLPRWVNGDRQRAGIRPVADRSGQRRTRSGYLWSRCSVAGPRGIREMIFAVLAQETARDL
jgi:hypothetical protein